jgi:hypothetical protein
MKFLFLLMIYFAGFATAVYVIVPAPAQAQDTSRISSDLENSVQQSTANFKDNQFTKIMSISVHKFVDLVKCGANKTIDYIQQQQNKEKG